MPHIIWKVPVFILKDPTQEIKIMNCIVLFNKPLLP